MKIVIVCVCHSIGNLGHRLFTHTIDKQVGTAVHENGRHQLVLPVVVMSQATHRRFDATDDNRHIGIELFENTAISDGTVVRTCAGFAFRRISIIGATTLRGRVMVNHRIHRAGRDRKIKTRTTELLEIAEVPVPVWLRHYRYAITRRFKYPTQHRCTKRRMVNIRIACEEDDVHFIPASQIRFLTGGRQIF